jgi:hypothetical protein
MKESIKNLTSSIGHIILSAIVIFNYLYLVLAIISAAWLLILGLWPSVVSGIIAAIAMLFIYFLIVLLPQQLFVRLLKYFIDRNKKILSCITIYIVNFYSNLIIILWTTRIFTYFLDNSFNHYVPSLIWGYVVALGPLSFMHSRETSEDIASQVGICLAQLSYFLSLVLWIMNISLGIWLVAFGTILFATPLLMVIYVSATWHQVGQYYQ